MHMQVVHNCYTPKEAVELVSRAGVGKANMYVSKVMRGDLDSFREIC